MRIAAFRGYKKVQKEDVANKIGLPSESHMDIENGRVKLNNIPAERLPIYIRLLRNAS